MASGQTNRESENIIFHNLFHYYCNAAAYFARTPYKIWNREIIGFYWRRTVRPANPSCGFLSMHGTDLCVRYNTQVIFVGSVCMFNLLYKIHLWSNYA